MASGLRRIGIAGVILGGLLFSSTSLAGPLDPLQFQSLGTLALTTPGTILTSGASPMLLAGANVYTGVFFNGIAVFDFDSVSIGPGVTLLATTGIHPIALLSRSSENISGSINISAVGSMQGAGASNTGVGGPGLFAIPPGTGAAGGGGGGFGGRGGNGSGMFTSGVPGGVGGDPRANLAGILQGGSAGGGSAFGVGGGGGGAIELGALQAITIGGVVSAAGGDGSSGGGGSGGGIYVHAPNVTLSGTLDVHGGFGVSGFISSQGSVGGSGGGGGGAILIEYSSRFSSIGVVNRNGGSGGALGGVAGSTGVFTASLVPEPSSLILLGTSTLGLIGVAAVRRRLRPGVEPRDE